MSRRFKFWLAVAVVFLAGNFAGLWMAIAEGQYIHACIHAALALVTALILGRTVARRIATS